MKIKIALSLCAATFVLSACGNDEVAKQPVVEAKVESPVTSDNIKRLGEKYDDIPAFDPNVIVGHWKNSEIPVLAEQYVVNVSKDCYETQIKNINDNVLAEAFVLEKFCFNYEKSWYQGTRQRTRLEGNNIVESEWMVSEGVRIMVKDDNNIVKQIMDSNRDFKMDFSRVK